MKLAHIISLVALSGATALIAAAPAQAGSDYYSASRYSSSNTHNVIVNASQRLPGLGANEMLCPTPCATSVDVPAGGRVIDCFSVCKKAEPVYVAPAPVMQTYHRAYQVVRPVVYVNYPVPVMVPSCPIYDAPSRYGSRYNSRANGPVCR
ncbi:MAG: hypothetical protein V3U82_00925 [Robiginitomaculum sp.]